MLITSLIFILLSNASTLRRDKSILYSRTTITVLLYSVIICVINLNTLLDKAIGLYGGLFHATSLTQIFHIFILIISGTIILLTSFYPRRTIVDKDSKFSSFFYMKKFYNNTDIINKMGEQFRIIEYPLILLFIISGGMFLVSTSDIVSIFLSIELQSYGLYLLSTLYRNSESSTSAGLTYFLLGGLSSCFILLGTSLIYANSACTNLDAFYIITNLSNMTNDYTNLVSGFYKPLYINVSLLIMSIGFLFKISAAPFHFWSPDVYDAIPTIVTTFVAIMAKISILVFFLELVHYTSNYLFIFDLSWTSSLLLSSLFSLVIGTVLGLTQFRIKRLLAYSTISHLGFILLALSINSIESIQAFIFYTMQYSISNLNAFFLLIAIGFSLYLYTVEDKNTEINKDVDLEQFKKLSDTNNSPIQLISQIKGYHYLNPVMALSITITLFSFVGIPPLVGFFAKQLVLSAALDSGFVFITLIAILTSVISAVYYLGIIKQIYFDKPFYILNKALKDFTLQGDASLTWFNTISSYSRKELFKIDSVVLAGSLTITISIISLILLLFIFTPHEWLSMANVLAIILFNP